MWHYNLALILSALYLLGGGDARTHSTTMSIVQVRRSKGWMFLDRMAFDAGIATVTLRLKLLTDTEKLKPVFPLELAMVHEDNWHSEQ